MAHCSRPSSHISVPGKSWCLADVRSRLSMASSTRSCWGTSSSVRNTKRPRFPAQRCLISRKNAQRSNGERFDQHSYSGTSLATESSKGQRPGSLKPSVLIAPYFGADADGSRAGWPEVLVDAIERCSSRSTSGTRCRSGARRNRYCALTSFNRWRTSSTAFTYTGFELCQDAVALLDEWVRWYRTGTMDPEGPLYELVQLNIA